MRAHLRGLPSLAVDATSLTAAGAVRVAFDGGHHAIAFVCDSQSDVGKSEDNDVAFPDFLARFKKPGTFLSGPSLKVPGARCLRTLEREVVLLRDFADSPANKSGAPWPACSVEPTRSLILLDAFAPVGIARHFADADLALQDLDQRERNGRPLCFRCVVRQLSCEVSSVGIFCQRSRHPPRRAVVIAESFQPVLDESSIRNGELGEVELAHAEPGLSIYSSAKTTLF